MNVLFRRGDGTFVIRLNGLPYHVILDDPLFSEAQATGADAPLEPALPDPTPDQVRAERNARLRESDIDVLRMFLGENLPVPREWRDYRQGLRDLPQQVNPSIPIIWPGKPGT